LISALRDVLSGRIALGLTLIAMFAVVAGCSRDHTGVGQADLGAAKSFNAYPLYWVGERFEEWELTHIDGIGGKGVPGFVSFGYGTCEIEDRDGLGPEGGRALRR
jgi:hypothetical protein